MTLSELINNLKETLELQGDIPVKVLWRIMILDQWAAILLRRILSIFMALNIFNKLLF